MATNSDGSIVLSVTIDKSNVSSEINKLTKLIEQSSKAESKTAIQAERLEQAKLRTAQQQQKLLQQEQKTAREKNKTLQSEEKVKQATEKTKQATEKTTQAQNKTTEAINKSKKATDTWKSATNNITSALGKMATALGIAFGIRELLRFSNEASKLAAQTESYILRIGQIYGEAGKQVSDFIDANSQALGMSKTAAYEAASSYGNLFSSFADGAENAKLTNNMLQTTAVIASKTGRTFDEVFTKIQSGIFGNTRAIDDLGVYVNQATLTTTKAFQTISDGRPWAQLTGNEQKQILTLAILEQSQAKYGNTVLQSTALTRSQFNAAFQDFKATWGQVINLVLMPVLKVLTAVFNYATMALKAVLAFFGKEVKVTGGAMSDISAGSAGIADNIDNATNSQKGLTKSVKDTNKEVKKTLAGFDDLEILSSNVSENAKSSGGGTGTGAISGGAIGGTGDMQITDTQVEVVSTYSQKLEELKLALIGIKDIDTTKLTNRLSLLQEALSKLGDLSWDMILWGVENVLTPIAKITVESILPRFIETLANVLNILHTVIKNSFALFKDFYNDFLKPLANLVTDKVLQYWDGWNEKLRQFSEDFENSTAWNDLRTILQAIYNILLPLITTIINFVTPIVNFVINQHWIMFTNILKNIEDLIGLIAAIITGDFDKAWNHLDNLLKNNPLKAVDDTAKNLKKAFTELKTEIGNFVTAFENKISEMVNIWKTKIQDWWDENVEPRFTKEKWEELFEKIGEALATVVAGTGGMIDTWKTNISGWWTDDVSPWFTIEKWEELFNNIVTGISNFFTGEDGFVNTWKTKISDWWEKDVSPWFTIEKWKELGTNIKDGIIKGVNGVVNGMKSVFNGIIDGFQSLVNGGIDMINSMIKGWNKVANVTPGLKPINSIGKVNLSKYKFNITPLAQGAVLPANKPFLAMVGDQKNGTNVEAPAKLIKQMAMEAIIEANANNQGQTVKEEHYYLDQTELMSILYKLVKGGERLKGNSLLN